jgi:hypothetical protein
LEKRFSHKQKVKPITHLTVTVRSKRIMVISEHGEIEFESDIKKR